MPISSRDREVLNLLRQHRDALTQPREIVHWAYFPTADARADFVVQTMDIGFQLDGMAEPTDRHREFGARVSHVDVPSEEIIERVTALLTHLAERCGGDYDGWETQVN